MITQSDVLESYQRIRKRSSLVDYLELNTSRTPIDESNKVQIHH